MKLGKNIYYLISEAVKCTGTFNPKEIFPFFVECLPANKAQTIYNFLEWCHKNEKRFGSGNFEEVFAEFNTTIAN